MVCFDGSLPLGMEFRNLPDAKNITVREPDMNFSESQSYVAVVLGGFVSDACRYAVRLKTAVASDHRTRIYPTHSAGLTVPCRVFLTNVAEWSAEVFVVSGKTYPNSGKNCMPYAGNRGENPAIPAVKPLTGAVRKMHCSDRETTVRVFFQETTAGANKIYTTG